MVQSWDKPTLPTHTLHTANPLKKVQWRPGHDTEIAIVPAFQNTSSAAVDAKTVSASQSSVEDPDEVDQEPHIEIWDVRRHYVAKYALASNDGAAIALEWSDENTIVTAYQNGTFGQMDIKQNCKLPLERIPRNVMAWNARGELAYAIDRFKSGEVPFDDLSVHPIPSRKKLINRKPEFSSHWDKVGQKQKSVSDDPYEPQQAVGVMPPIDPADESHFDLIAHGYRLEGESPETLCWWNAEVAESCGRLDDSRFWAFLRLYIEEFAQTRANDESQIFTNPFASKTNPTTTTTTSPRGHTLNMSATPKSIPLKRLEQNLDVEELTLSSSSSSASSCSSDSDSTDRETTTAPNRSRFLAFAPPDNRRLSESVMASSMISSTLTAIPAGQTSARTTPRTLFAQVIGPAGVRAKPRTNSSNSNSNSNGYSDYPDPYGVVPGTPPSNRMSVSRIITRPTEKGHASLSTSSKASPVASKRPSPQVNANRNVAAPPRVSLGDASMIPNSDGEYVDEDWVRYKNQRAETVLEWWKCYVNDVSISG